MTFGAVLAQGAATIPPARERRGPGRRRSIALAAGFLATLVLGLLLELGARPLELEEPRRAMVALELWLRGAWVVPTTNGVAYLNKPPLFSWVLLGVMRSLGTAEHLLRLPTVVSFLAAAAVLFAAARRRLGRTGALTAAGVFLSFTSLVFYGTLHADIDLLLTLLVLLQALAIFALEQRGRPLAMFAASYALAALAFLTKGFPALAFQALTLVGWLVAARRARWLASWQHLAGLATFALLAGGYLALYAREADPVVLLVRLLRDSGERTVVAERYGPGALALHLVTFPLRLVEVALPWSLFAGLLLAPAARARLRHEPLLRFAAVFLCVNILPYWLSPGTRPRYLFPFLPFAALLLGAALGAGEPRGAYGRALRWTLGVALPLCALAPLAVPAFAEPWRHVQHPAAWFACAAALLGAAVAYWRAPDPTGRLLAVLLAVALARVQYDLLVPAYRAARSDDGFHRRVAEALNRDFAAEPIYLAGRRQVKELRVPVLGRTVSWTDREFFANALTYYYELGRGQLLRYADAPAPGQLLLVHAGYAGDRPHEVVRAFDHRGAAFDLELVRVRP